LDTSREHTAASLKNWQGSGLQRKLDLVGYVHKTQIRTRNENAYDTKHGSDSGGLIALFLLPVTLMMHKFRGISEPAKLLVVFIADTGDNALTIPDQAGGSR
jgi:hypothetical protein